MAKTVRVFQVAKELGVQSKDIVTKCQAEDIPGITNHMSTVSVGLAQTIREWFSGGGVATAVETAPKVNVDEARRKARSKAKPKKAARKTKPSKEETEASSDDAPASTEQESQSSAKPAQEPAASAAPATTPETVESAAPARGDAADDDAALRPAAAAAADSAASGAAPADTKGADAAASAPGQQAVSTPPAEKTAPKAVENEPTRPVVKPAGPMNKPKEASLAGPRVIRVEQPDQIDRPRRTQRPRTGPAGGGGVGIPRGGYGMGPNAAPGAGSAPGDSRRGGGGGAGGGGASRRNRRRTASGREEAPGRTARDGADRGANWRQQDLLEREQRLNRSGGFFKAHRRDNIKRAAAGQRATSPSQSDGPIRIEEPITLKSLSAATGIRVNDIIRELVRTGTPLVAPDAVVSSEQATLIMAEFDVELDIVEQVTAEQQIRQQFKSRTMIDEQPRSPVVTILGHVDHGKTTLLDNIRHANVAEGEAGGITQATSAFQVPVRVGEDDHVITFIDTPGHEAFTEMRSRGAQMTDIVVLVVAADDGVMPQTVESINHAKAAGVPIIVALNKVDKAEATDSNIQRILGQLAEHELNPTDWGGSTEVVRISAIKGEGISDLLEVLDLQAQLLELKADAGGPAEGAVIEAQLEEGRGAVARILVQQGKLSKGDVIVVGRAYGRVRDIVDDHGKRIQQAGPSMPVAISGINEVPDAGDRFYVVKNIREAEAAAAERVDIERNRDLATEKVTLDNIFQKLSDSGRKELPLIVKADVQGSIETLKATVTKIRNSEVEVTIKHAAVGPVNESDIQLAEAAGAIIVGFNVSATAKARRMAEDRRVDIRYYDVIYDLTDDVTKAAEGLLDPEVRIEVLGHAEVREVFRVSKVGLVAGCYVTDGTIERNALVRVTRDGIVIEKDRKLEQLKRFKDDAREVKSGQECGMKVAGYDDIKVGDVLECYKTKEFKRSLND